MLAQVRVGGGTLVRRRTCANDIAATVCLRSATRTAAPGTATRSRTRDFVTTLVARGARLFSKSRDDAEWRDMLSGIGRFCHCCACMHAREQRAHERARAIGREESASTRERAGARKSDRERARSSGRNKTTGRQEGGPHVSPTADRLGWTSKQMLSSTSFARKAPNPPGRVSTISSIPHRARGTLHALGAGARSTRPRPNLIPAAGGPRSTSASMAA